MNIYTYKGVTATEPPNGVICVEDALGHIVALTTNLKHAAQRFVQAVQERP